MDAEETMKQKRYEERDTLEKSQPCPDMSICDIRTWSEEGTICEKARGLVIRMG